jgi:hypothetical protein
MIRIAISPEAFDAIAKTMPMGSVDSEAKTDAEGKVLHVWLEEKWLNRLKLLRGPGESYSDAILRLAEAEAKR